MPSDGSRVFIGAYGGMSMLDGMLDVFTPSQGQKPSYSPTDTCSILNISVTGISFYCVGSSLFATSCNYDDVTGAQFHSSFTFGACSDFACPESDVRFFLNGFTLSCAIFGFQLPETINLAYSLPNLAMIYRKTYGLC